MTTMTANRQFNGFASTRAVASVKATKESIWSVISKSLEMAHVVGEFGTVSKHQMAQIRSIAATL